MTSYINFVSVGVLAMVAQSAQAREANNQSWNFGSKLQINTQQINESKKSGDASEVKSSSSEIALHRAEIKISGEQGQDKLEIIYLFDSSTLETATITHKMNDTVSILAGKMFLLTQSWEWDYHVADQYFYSAASSLSPAEASNGAQLNLLFGDHTINLQAVQGMNSIETPTGSKVTFESKGGLSTAIQYRSEISKMIRPIMTYTTIRTASSKGSDGNNYGNGYQNQIGVGVQIAANNTVIDAELDTVKQLKFKNSAADTNKDIDTQSIILQAKYSIGDTTPLIKLSLDSKKTGMSQAQIDTGNEGDLTGMQIAAGLEYKLDETCRLHAIYRNNNSSAKIAGGKNEIIKTTGFNLGITATM